MTMQKASHPKDDFDRLCVSRTEGKEDLPALKTALANRYNGLKITERLITATINYTNLHKDKRCDKTENKRGNKDNTMDVLSDYQVTSYSRKCGRG